MKHLRQYIRAILEVRAPDDDERSDTHKLIQLFLSEYGTAQAIDLAEMLPDINPRVVELFSKIKSQVEEIIELGRGNFPEEWAKDTAIQRYGLKEGPYLGPFMKAVRELRNIAETEASGDDEAWRESGKGSMALGKEFQGALRAISVVVKGKQTPEQMMATTMGMGTHFVAIAERFGIWL
jgi:hypothetical protein